MKVEVVEHRPEWKALFHQEAATIQSILGEDLQAIHHIGSTAVPGLKAKPIIDILAVVQDIAKVDFYHADFQKMGYEAKGEFGISGRRYFRKGEDIRTVQVHIFEERNEEDLNRHLAVRDYLRHHKQVAFEYGELKEQLAKQHPADIQAYSEGKDVFVKNLEKKAPTWYRNQN